MAVNTTVQVTLPAMGESVREGTVLEWHKREGDLVAADETIVEISTDKVDAEVPTPVAGTLLKIFAAVGDTVAVGAVLAEIAPGNGAAAAAPGNGAAAPAPDDAEPAAAAAAADGDGAPAPVIIDIVTPGGG
ncbi:MAG TPA: biotin/lipoyl-containing protein, partial [Solirubrobacteraceae bacterium]|nr:biotin/lipoyl-containing protein [Solirubrobacteraceae bacterium]